MIDLHKAILSFNKYISYYDKSEPLLNLKIVHTFNVMAVMEYLCEIKKLDEEDTSLALLIALLHDLGRFEQFRIYKSFEDYKTIDHAQYSSELLFKKNKIRYFIDDTNYDDIIKTAIEQHNKYKIDDIEDEKTLLFVYLIRDADKLDNFRVKETEKIETLFNISLEKLEKEEISDVVYKQFCEHQLIYGPSRKTHLDMWISYIAFIFDLHFDESIQYICDHHWIDRSFDRVQPKDKKYYQLKIEMNKYIEERKNEI